MPGKGTKLFSGLRFAKDVGLIFDDLSIRVGEAVRKQHLELAVPEHLIDVLVLIGKQELRVLKNLPDFNGGQGFITFAVGLLRAIANILLIRKGVDRVISDHFSGAFGKDMLSVANFMVNGHKILNGVID